MSVVNTMLKDLQQRQVANTTYAHPIMAHNLHAEIEKFSKIKWLKKFSLLIIFMAMVIFFVYVSNQVPMLFSQNSENSLQNFEYSPVEDVNEQLAPAVFKDNPQDNIQKVLVHLAKVNKDFNNIEILLNLDDSLKGPIEKNVLSDSHIKLFFPGLFIEKDISHLFSYEDYIREYTVEQKSSGLSLTLYLQPNMQLYTETLFSDEEHYLALNIVNNNAVSEVKPEKSFPEENSTYSVRQLEVHNGIKAENYEIRQSADSYYQQAISDIAKNRIISAEKKLLQALEVDQYLVEARELLFNLYVNGDRTEEAYSLLEQGIALMPGNIEFVKIYAQALFSEGKAKEALAVLQKKYDYAKTDFEYHTLYGAITQRLGLHKKAVEQYMYALNINADDGKSWLGLAISLDSLGKESEAIQAYQSARKFTNLDYNLVQYINARLDVLTES